MATNINFETNLPIVSVRGTEGVFLLSPVENNYSKVAKFNDFHDENKNCRITAFDSNGKLFAYCNGSQVKIIDLVNNCQVLLTIDKPRTSYLKFSPLGTYIVLWETFYVTKDEHKEVANLNMYEVRGNGSVFKSFVQRKQIENLVQWTNDESIFCLMNTNEVVFFDRNNPETPVNKIRIENLSNFSLSPVSKCVAVHVSGKKSEPSAIRLFQYPNVDTPVANKSFFNADKVEFKWNKSGKNLLLLCSTETSANSYYGDTTLHEILINGESQLVQLSKTGPIYTVEWNPAKDEFIVVYGTMPAKATLFNAKCEAIYDFGTGPRNECFFSTHGNMVAICGFGNLRGRVEIWNLSTQNKIPQEICSIQADDTTYFEWAPDSEHILTATTSPRLRVSNGFKIWNYNGNLLYNYQLPANNELWQIKWQPGKYQQKTVVKQSAAPVKTEETKAYVPPHLRNANNSAKFKTKLHDDDEKPDKNLKIKPTKSEAEELEKKIKTLKKKIAQIDELKKKKAAGEKLEKNQLEKLNNEKELIDELKKLEI